jgi:hypothetical protein
VIFISSVTGPLVTAPREAGYSTAKDRASHCTSWG